MTNKRWLNKKKKERERRENAAPVQECEHCSFTQIRPIGQQPKDRICCNKEMKELQRGN